MSNVGMKLSEKNMVDRLSSVYLKNVKRLKSTVKELLHGNKCRLVLMLLDVTLGIHCYFFIHSLTRKINKECYINVKYLNLKSNFITIPQLIVCCVACNISQLYCLII